MNEGNERENIYIYMCVYVSKDINKDNSPLHDHSGKAKLEDFGD